ncbi:MAG: hemolysin family protein [Lawsonella sp.]
MGLLLQLLSLVGFVAITFLTAMFVAAEFSLTALEKSAVDREVAQGIKGAKKVQHAHQNLSFALSGTQVGITITTLVTGYLAEPVLAQFLKPLLEKIPNISASAVDALSLTIALILATILSMVYGELLPKNWAISQPMRVAHKTAPFLMRFSKMLKFVISGLNNSANAIIRLFGFKPVDELASARSPAELDRIVEDSASGGILPAQTAIVVQRSLRFNSLSAEDIMTPRSQVVTIDGTATAKDLLYLTETSGLSRFPVVDGDLDTTLGIVHVKDGFVVPTNELDSVPVTKLMKPLPRVPDSLDADSLLDTIRPSGQQSALVIDEYGGAAGLVTMEDIIEEILGDVRDEHDKSLLDVLKRGHSWDCSGQLRRDEIYSATNYLFPDHPAFDTLGGLIMWKLGRIPAVGDALLLPTEPKPLSETGNTEWRAHVLSMDGRRVDRVLLTPNKHTSKDGEA